MTDLLEKCEICGALLDEEDLFCANCGAEAPRREQADAPTTELSTHNFECRGCGASMSYDASAQALRCPFCGNENLEQQQDARTLRPQRVVPFVVTQDQAVAAMRKWLGGSFWRPGDLAQKAMVTKMTPVYVPYWVFAARTFTYWTADTNQTPPGARGDWCPLSGEHRGAYQGVLIGSSSALTPHETSSICPYDLGRGVPPEQVDLENAVFEQFRVPRKYARPLARQGLEEMERAACSKYVPGRTRNVKVNVRLEDMRSEPVLLPVWIMAYRYKDKLFRFLVNGQTGRATGQAPTSWRKIAAVVGIVLAVILLIVLLMMTAGGLAALFGSTSASPHVVTDAAMVSSVADAASIGETLAASPTQIGETLAASPTQEVDDRFQTTRRLVNSCTSGNPLAPGLTDAVVGAAAGRTRHRTGCAEDRRLVARRTTTHAPPGGAGCGGRA
ncbi:MAG: hypothetical protein RIC55_14585 [Pirellulaceae bacterium]